MTQQDVNKLAALDRRIAKLHEYRLRARANGYKQEQVKIERLRAQGEIGRQGLWGQTTDQLKVLIAEREVVADRLEGEDTPPLVLHPDPDTIEWSDPLEWDAILDPKIGQ